MDDREAKIEILVDEDVKGGMGNSTSHKMQTPQDAQNRPESTFPADDVWDDYTAGILKADENGDTALHVAARSANLDVVENLMFREFLSEGRLHLNKPAAAKTLQQKNKLGFQALHYAVQHSGERWTNVVMKLLYYTEDSQNSDGDTALHLAAAVGNVGAAKALVDHMLGGLDREVGLVKDKHGNTALDIAPQIRGGGGVVKEILRLGKLPNEFFWTMLKSSTLEERDALLVLRFMEVEIGFTATFDDEKLRVRMLAEAHDKRFLQEWKYDALEWLVKQESFDVNYVYEGNRSALHLAILEGYPEVAKDILRRPQLIDASGEDDTGATPLQYAVEKRLGEIEALLIKRSEVRECVERLYRDRQVYVDASNAILVGAALIAGVTFAGWLQPPLGYGGAGSTYAAVQGHAAVSTFWVFNSLSFSCAIATVMAAATGVIPNQDTYIATAVQSVRSSLTSAASTLVLAVVFVLGAFGSAGVGVLPPALPWQANMIVTLVLGGLLNVVFLSVFLSRLYPLRPWYAHRKRQTQRKARRETQRRQRWTDEQRERVRHIAVVRDKLKRDKVIGYKVDEWERRSSWK